MEKRIEWIDTLKGIGIILVVWGHLNLPLLTETVIYSFHMPLFFFISGYLYKNKEISLGQFIRAKCKSLLILYFIYASISFPFAIALDFYSDKSVNFTERIINFFFLNGSVGWNSPIWFLVVLFFIEVIYFMLRKYTNKNFLFICVSFLIGYCLSLTGKEFPLGINIISWGLVFYYFGNLFKEKLVVETLAKTIPRTVFSLFSLGIVNILFGLFLNIRISVYHNHLGNYLYFYISAIAGILFMFILAKSIPAFRILKFYGKNTLLILSTHYFFIYGFRILDGLFFNSHILKERSLIISISLAIFILVSFYPISYIINRYFPFMVGKRKKSNTIFA